MDSLPPPPPVLAPVPPPALPGSASYGAGDIYPNVGAHAKDEAAMCDRAARPDWLYLGGLALLDVGAFYFEAQVNNDTHVGVRLLGPAAIGFTWGATLGGGYLALPKCDRHWVTFPPREGDVHVSWPLAITIAGLAGITAPILVGTAQGPLQPTWTTEERISHLAIASGFAITGALLPYISVLAPKTWRAARELERLRATADGKSAYVGYTLTF